MLPKQTDYKVGMYLRLSRDDERQGESLSIENQRRVLTNYVKEHSGEDCLYFLPTVANILRMTVGTLRNRPEDIQLTLCKHYTDVWLCDEDTIKRELEDVLMLRMKTF